MILPVVAVVVAALAAGTAMAEKIALSSRTGPASRAEKSSLKTRSTDPRMK